MILAKTLDCSVMDFFADDNEIISKDIVLDEDERDIIRLFRMLSRKERHEFMSRAYWYENKLKDDEGNVE